MTIDSHVHFWKYDKQHYSWIDKSMKMLQKDHLPEHIDLTLKRNGVDGCVAVQADPSEFDTYFLGELSETHPVIKGVVGWIDLQGNNVEERLRHFSSYSLIKGYRHIVQSEPDDFLYNDSFRQGLSSLHEFGYTYDLLIYPRQLKLAIDLVKSFPDQPFVLDHCAKPRVKEKQMEDWKKGIEEIAAYPNIHCKLSGLLTEANWKDWSPGDFYPYLDIIFKAFGTDRLLFGSDWPVMLLSGIYVQWKSLLEKYMEHFIPEDKEKVFGMNAQHFYNL
jgi:L-fuconolactonase